MARRGDVETEKLVEGLKDRLHQLLAQLEDVEELKEDLDEEEYQTTRKETLDQIKEFEHLVQKTVKGNMTLVDELNAVQLAIQAAVSEACKTPEVLKWFAKREPGQLRGRLTSLQREQKLGKLSLSDYESHAVEVLYALQKMGETLTASEQQFLEKHTTSAMRNMTAASGGLGSDGQAAVLSTASRQIEQNR